MNLMLVGFDPSYASFGRCYMDFDEKSVHFNLFSHHLERMDYASFFESAADLVAASVHRYLPPLDERGIAGVEIPPPQGQMAPALWGLSFKLIEQLGVWYRSVFLFQPSWLGFLLHTRKYSRTDVVNYASTILWGPVVGSGFKVYDEEKLVKEGGRIKNDKLVAFLFCVRLMIRMGMWDKFLKTSLLDLDDKYLKLSEEKEKMHG